jgi:hypothetical protein
MTRDVFVIASTAIALTLALPCVAHAEEPEPPAAPSDATTAASPVVDLSADDARARIERRATTTSPTVPIFETGMLSVGNWEHACVAPCQLRLDPRYSYRVAGDGLVPSESFVLPRGQDRVRVDAKMGSSVGRVAGVVAAAGGVLAMAGGGLALAATPILASEDVGSEGFRSGVLAGGIGMLSVGAISTAIGLFLWLSNGSNAHAEPSSARQASR